MNAIEIILIILGPGSLFAYLLGAVAEITLALTKNPAYFMMGSSKVHHLDSAKVERIPDSFKATLKDGTQLIRIPVNLFFYRLVIPPSGEAQLKAPYFLWIGQIAVVFITLLLWYTGQTEAFPTMPLGLEFLFGGLHLHLHSVANKKLRGLK